ncbi:MAG: beta-lactamase family protein [Sphingobacteriaceae bacterium]|nr:beta-lactamase family protein [Sphingobacteriaceae bacterium]
MKRLVYILILTLFNYHCSDNSNSKKISQNKAALVKSEKANNESPKTILENRLDSVFSFFNVIGAFNGSVLVAKKGKVLFRNHYGVCDKKKQNPVNDSSLFQLASVTKVITSTAVLILMEKGLIDLEKNVTEYLPDFPYEGITIKHLLAHRSGLPNYIYAFHSSLYIENYKMTNKDMYDLFVEKKPSRYLRPNRRFNYSNTNYALLAILIEKVSGKKYSDFIRDEIFIPLGMKHSTTIDKIKLTDPNIAKPYDERWKPVEFDASDYVLGDKSVYSTTYDLFLFSEAMYNNKILSAGTQSLAYKAYSKEKVATNYGFGWRLKDYKKGGNIEVYHNGWWHGYRSSFHRKLNDSLTIIVLSNQLNKAAYQTQLIYDILNGNKESNPEAEVND